MSEDKNTLPHARTIDFIMNKAKPVFERWGYAVEIVRADRDYLDLFYRL